MAGAPSRVQAVTNWVLLFFALTVIAITLGLFEGRRADSTALQRLVLEKKQEEPVSTSWVDTGGLTRTVNTPRFPQESLGDWLDRHDQEVAAALARYPQAP